MNYTKGKWVVTLGGSEMPKEQRIIHAELGLEHGIMNVRTICRIFDYADTAENLGNAQLIASSPELYEALKEVQQSILFDDKEGFGTRLRELLGDRLTERLNNAINKAEGKT